MVITLLLGGCSGRPPRLKQLTLVPTEAASQAMKAYDSDADGKIDKSELESSPSLKAAMAQFDGDGDGTLTEEEIKARLEGWLENRSALFPIPCTVLRRGQPLADATVVLEPEPFLGEAFVQVSGVTDSDGMAELAVESGPYRGLPGIPYGLYRIRISKQDEGRERLPKKYNEETLLGQEICDDAAGLVRGLVFELK